MFQIDSPLRNCQGEIFNDIKHVAVVTNLFGKMLEIFWKFCRQSQYFDFVCPLLYRKGETGERTRGVRSSSYWHVKPGIYSHFLTRKATGCKCTPTLRIPPTCTRDADVHLMHIAKSAIVPITLKTRKRNFFMFLTVYHSIDLFHLPTLMHKSLFINNMYVTLQSSTCFEHQHAHLQEDKLHYHSIWYHHCL